MEACNRLLDRVDDARRLMSRAAADQAVALDAAQTHMRSLLLPGKPVADSEGRGPARDASGRVIPRWSPETIATETLVSEVSALLRQSHDSTKQLLWESEQLVQHLPATLALLRAGDISYWHAQIMVAQSSQLPEALFAEFEKKVLTDAEWLSAEQLRRRAVRVRERLNPESITRRHKKALSERWVRLTDTDDGMSYLEMYVSSDDAHAITNRITTEARALRRAAAGTDDTRTQAQFRADIATDLLLEGVTASGLGHGVRATVHLTVPAMTLMGHSDEPGLLDGVQPIDPETARRLAGTATGFTRLLVHPETGVVLSVGRDRYHVPAGLRKAVEIRDLGCRAPGCTRPAGHDDVDHTHDWALGGETNLQNLALLCRYSHRLKHETGWQVSQDKKGTLHWISPAGRHYPTFPEPRMSPPDLTAITKTKKQITAELEALEPRPLTHDELWALTIPTDETIPF
ncbi:HNH endonuclease [Cryobacterium frigoriphilum]|uniref:HNH endonuclease n=1 Tax=Cryobacterium frigoriphilum TaxID=1259150 RepID=A0A4R8ZUM7_9MICO|nr:HNH endonuclease signature motif containing protein [Cryobacterium frigoriphilum]TFD46333.1 HNH endonuclease [Cryobacterium frigoriphilum]